MKRLNDCAFNLLQTEIRRCLGANGIGQVQAELALRRLEKLRQQTGSPVMESELQAAISDLIPQANPKVFSQAAKINRPASKFWARLKFGTALLVLGAGTVGVANLPIPGIRNVVLKEAPFLLAPTHMSMHHHYRSAIALIEQADQLVNQATAFEDHEFGAEKVKAAQTHLDQLPVSLLEDPEDYCNAAGCSFTTDEFRVARQTVARMEAKLFQEKNAQTRFEQSNQRLAESIRMIDNGALGNDRARALADWRSAIDALDQLPKTTLAGRLAQNKITALERDFRAIVGSNPKN